MGVVGGRHREHGTAVGEVESVAQRVVDGEGGRMGLIVDIHASEHCLDVKHVGVVEVGVVVTVVAQCDGAYRCLCAE